ncbi:hypothetical protein AB205_0142410, partial [Aquarana catesbeiana]
VKNRCDEKNLLTTKTECMSCTLNAAVNCSEGYLKASHGSGQRDCRYFLEIRSYSLSLPGCRHLCTKVEAQPKCCPGYWGPDCMEVYAPMGWAAMGPVFVKKNLVEQTVRNAQMMTRMVRTADLSVIVCTVFATVGLMETVHACASLVIMGLTLADCAVLNCRGNKRCTMSSSGALECKCLPNYEEKSSTCE